MEDIPHKIIGRNMDTFRYPKNQTGSRTQNAVEAVQASSRETNVKGTTVVEPGRSLEMYYSVEPVYDKQAAVMAVLFSFLIAIVLIYALFLYKICLPISLLRLFTHSIV